MALARRFASSRNWIAISAIAVLIPTAILFWLQYRSLQQLRAKTSLAAQDQVRQDMDVLRKRLEDRVTTIAAEALGQFDNPDLQVANLSATSAKFHAILEKYPVIGHVFTVSECSCGGDPYAILSVNSSAEWVKCSRFSEPIIADALRAHRGARSLPNQGEFAELLYFQSGLRPVLYAFRYLPGPTDKGSLGNLGIRNPKDTGRWAGLEIQSDPLLREMVPKVLADLKRRGGDSLGQLALTVSESGRVVFSTEPGLRNFETTVHAGALFPFWTFAGRYKGATIESLAQEQFRNGLALSGAVLCCLILAIALSLRAMAREAKLAELKSAFVSNVSHEMKTPLSLIRMFAETLELGRVKEPEKLQEYYSVIHSESWRLSQLVDRVLDFSRIESGRKQYKFAEADVAGIVEDVLSTYEPQIVSSGFTLAVDAPPHLSPALVDAEAISRALLNLVDNAMKYSSDRKKLSVRVSECGKEILIEVADRGIGIAESEQERIFEKFYRVSNGLVHDTKGSGLGLTLTKHIVEAHGGRIHVDSRPGHGSRFTISVPLGPPGTVRSAERAPSGEPIAESAHH